MREIRIIIISLVVIFIACKGPYRSNLVNDMESHNIEARLDSLMADLSEESDCTEIIRLAAQVGSYLPEGEKHGKIYSSDYEINEGLLGCMRKKVQSGDKEAESVLLSYFKAYYSQIQKEGRYNMGHLFEYLDDCRSEEYREFLLELADSEYKYDRVVTDYVFEVEYIRRYGQVRYLASIKTIYGFEDIYSLHSRIIIEVINSPEYRNIRKEDGDTNILVWRKAYLPIIEKAMEDDAIVYIGYGEDLEFSRIGGLY